MTDKIKMPPVIDAKWTGHYPNTGLTCFVCETDAGDRPLRLTFEGIDDDKYCHEQCAYRVEAEDKTFFAPLRS